LEGTAVSVGAGLGTGILEGNPPSFYAPSTDSFFGEGGCVAPAVRSGTGRHTFRRRPNGVVSIFSRRFFELARSIFTRSGGTFSSTFFSFFSPLVACTICALCGARNAYRCSNGASVLFFSHRRPDILLREAAWKFYCKKVGITDSSKRRNGDQGEAPSAELCCLLIRSLSET